MRKAYPAVLDSLDALRTDADAFCAENRIDADSVFALNLCLEEVFSNSAIYGCGLSPDKKIEVSLSAAGGKIVAEVSDSAQPFNPLKQVPPPDLKADVYSRSVGGLGIFLVKE